LKATLDVIGALWEPALQAHDRVIQEADRCKVMTMFLLNLRPKPFLPTISFKPTVLSFDDEKMEEV